MTVHLLSPPPVEEGVVTTAGQPERLTSVHHRHPGVAVSLTVVKTQRVKKRVCTIPSHYQAFSVQSLGQRNVHKSMAACDGFRGKSTAVPHPVTHLEFSACQQVSFHATSVTVGL